MRVLLSLFFWFYLAASLIVYWFVLVIPWLISLPFDPTRRFTHWYAYTWANHFLTLAPFWHVRVENRELLPDRSAAVLVANHQSSADIMMLFTLRKPFRWVSKASLFNVPFLGWTMRMAGYVPIRRGSTSSRNEMMQRCRELLDQNVPVAIFPEGTRSTEAKMRPFKRGAFVLATEAKVPVIPIVIHGTRNSLPRNTWIFAGQNKVYPIVHVMEAVDPADFDYNSKELCAEVRRRMELRREEIRRRGGAEASAVESEDKPGP